ncbi:MAG: transcription elongation GreA/GreB family factor, partial [Planctomycetota bacterium]
EQRNLTGRAQEMDEQIKSAKLIEDQEIPDDVVAPGQTVTLVEQDEEAKKSTYRILGPWDMTDDTTINYMAPMAQGLLGLAVGDIGEMPSLAGPIKVQIKAIELIDLQ